MSQAKTNDGYKVLVVLPARDEEASIGGVLQKIRKCYPSLDVLVVDDGSNDRTADVGRENRANIISHAENLGVVGAVQTGRVYALSHDYDFVVFCDADGQHDPSDMGKILQPLLSGEADFVIGSRERGDYIGKEPLLLKLPRHFCSLLISFLARKRVTDPTSGYKGWNRSLITHFKVVYETSEKLHLSTTNDMEEILIAHKKGAKIKEVPVRMFVRQGASEIYGRHNLVYFFTVFPRHLIRTVWRNLR